MRHVKYIFTQYMDREYELTAFLLCRLDIVTLEVGKGPFFP